MHWGSEEQHLWRLSGVPAAGDGSHRGAPVRSLGPLQLSLCAMRQRWRGGLDSSAPMCIISDSNTHPLYTLTAKTFHLTNLMRLLTWSPLTRVKAGSFDVKYCTVSPFDPFAFKEKHELFMLLLTCKWRLLVHCSSTLEISRDKRPCAQCAPCLEGGVLSASLCASLLRFFVLSATLNIL